MVVVVAGVEKVREGPGGQTWRGAGGRLSPGEEGLFVPASSRGTKRAGN